MFFTIKIIRFVVGLFIKAILLPFKLVARLVGMGSSDDTPTDAFDFDPDTAAATDSEGESSDTVASGGQSRKHIRWFRKGLFGVGIIQLVIALVMAAGFSEMAFNSGGAMLFGSFIVILLLYTAIPISIALLLPRRPTGAWYAGMGFIALQGLVSLGAGLAGIVWAAVYGAVGYCGYSGRPALATVYGDESVATAGESPSSTPAQTTDSVDPMTNAGVSGESKATGGDGTPADTDATQSTESASQVATPATETTDDPSNESQSTPATENTESSTAVSDDGRTRDIENDANESDTEAGGSEAADESTSQQPDGAVAEYRDDLTAEDPAVRETAVLNLTDAVAEGAVPDQSAIDAITDRLDDDASAVRVAACEALGRIGTTDIEPRLQDLRIDRDSEVSRAASRALRNIE